MRDARFVLYVVFPDGVPRDVECFDTLRAALTDRDMWQRGVSQSRVHYGVWDSDDPESGDQGWDDAEEEPDPAYLRAQAVWDERGWGGL